MFSLLVSLPKLKKAIKQPQVKQKANLL